MMKRIAILFVLCGLLSCAKQRDGEPPRPIIVPQPNAPLSELVDMCRDNCYVIDSPICVEAIVTANDESSNISNMLYVESDGVALQIRVRGTQLHSRYPIGCRVLISAQGLALQRYMGCAEVGSANIVGGECRCDYIYSDQILDRTIFLLSEHIEQVRPLEIAISEIDNSLYGRLVRIEALNHIPDDGVLESEPTFEGYHLFCDSEGGTITSYVSPYADFSGEPLPLDATSLEGILLHSPQYGNMLRIIKVL